MNVVHLCWDIMVGLGTLLFLFTLWYWASWIFRRDMPRSRWFLRGPPSPDLLAVVTLEAGWTLSEVGRQPWIVYNQMKVADAATTNTGVWMTFIAVTLLYAALGITHDSGAARDEPPRTRPGRVRGVRRPVRPA